MQKHKIEKIKTIGDAYMAAGGLPTPNQTHAKDVVNAALDIQEYMRNHRLTKEAKGDLFFEIRIGIHTGPVVAGIVGVKKFQYDIWGDTVNTASRMESSGEIGKVNISGTTYEAVKDDFNCSHRGKIAAKGKGEIDMYFVERNEPNFNN
jgi:class 3 adenylate cyclase